MRCECGKKLKVIDSVHTPNNEIIRKRKCSVCNKFIFTLEDSVEYDDYIKQIWNQNYRKNLEDK